MPGKVTLRATHGPIAGTPFEFVEAQTAVFGRDPECQHQLPLGDEYASRSHFLLEVNPPDASIQDLGSLDGTFVNDVKYGGRVGNESPEEAKHRTHPVVPLRHGDRVRAGETTFVVDVEESTTQQRALDRDKLQQFVEALLGQAPPKIAGYDFGERLGSGGYGAVFAVVRQRDGARLALKTLLARRRVDKKAAAELDREASITCQLRHENVVESFEFGTEGDVFWLTMERCNGGSVDKLMSSRPGGRLSLTEAGPIMMQALAGLQYAHEAEVEARCGDGTKQRVRGVVHRDLKPHNLMLTGSEGSWTTKVGDFGLAKAFTLAGLSKHTRTGEVGGAPCFMPREQVVNYKYVKPVSDIWSMGATFYNMLLGCAGIDRPIVPYDFPSGKDPISIIMHQPIIPIRERDPSVPARIAGVIDQAIQIDTTDRFQSAAEFRRALEQAL